MNPQINPQELLFDRLDFSYPGLERAKGLLESGDKEGCMAEIVRHFASRENPKYLFERVEMEKLDDPETFEEAQKTLDHDIYGYKFGGPIDWHFNPTAGTSRDNEWSWSLFRLIYWQPLARAYVLTGDEKYTREFLAQLHSFYENWPVKPFMEDAAFEKTFTFPGHAWRTIETAMRFYTTWMPCYVAFRTSKEWDGESWAVFLNLICDTAEFLMGHYSNHNRSSNWLTMESSGLFQCGLLFPEMKNAGEWFHTGYQRVMHEIKYSFDNDGIHMERTPIYHLVAVIVYLQAYRLCLKNDIPVPPYALSIFERAADFVMYHIKPDLSTPMIGDADRDDLTTRRADTSIYEGMNLSFDPYDLNELRAFYRVMYELTGREDFLYFATCRKEGKAPEKRNYISADAGFFVMRSGWEEKDNYFHLHGVSLERGERSTHSHNDQGHLELHIKGEDILQDTGRYIYRSSIWKNWRAYIDSAKAHNTLEIENHRMGAVPDTDERIRGVRTHCHHFEETKDYQLIDISHNGYAFMEDPIFHRRRVVALPGDVFVIDDQITGLGIEEHDFNLYFNFAPGKLNPAGNGVWDYATSKGTAYQMTTLGGHESEILEGSEDPIGGWVSYGYPIRQPVPQLRITKHGKAPQRFITVIAPAGTTVSGDYDMKKAALTINGKTLTLEPEEVSVSAE